MVPSNASRAINVVAVVQSASSGNKHFPHWRSRAVGFVEKLNTDDPVKYSTISFELRIVRKQEIATQRIVSWNIDLITGHVILHFATPSYEY